MNPPPPAANSEPPTPNADAPHSQRATRNPQLPPFRERVRLRFAKTGDLRFIGHQDLLDCWERALRRAAIPVRFTEGFHPKPLLSSPLSLALGVEGLDEILEIDLTEPMDDEELRRRLEPELDPGLTIVDMSRPLKSDKTRVVAVEYESPLLDVSEAAARESIHRFTLAEAVPIQRALPGKPIKRLDLKPMVLGFAVDDGTLRFRVAVTPKGAARPEEVLQALGFESLLDRGAVLRRTRVDLERPLEADGEVPPTASAADEPHHWPPNQQGAPS